jgi:predicted nucleic acid-binding protein
MTTRSNAAKYEGTCRYLDLVFGAASGCALGEHPDDVRACSLVADRRVVIIGPIRQELLSGIKDHAQFERLRHHLRAFSDTEISVHDYEEAASFYNQCRARGIQGSSSDFLICAIASRNDLTIFTADEDFLHFAQVLPIVLHAQQM